MSPVPTQHFQGRPPWVLVPEKIHCFRVCVWRNSPTLGRLGLLGGTPSCAPVSDGDPGVSLSLWNPPPHISSRSLPPGMEGLKWVSPHL